MATCNDCLHCEVCKWTCLPPKAEQCVDFKERARFVELPCKMGDTLYMIVTKRARVHTPEFSFIKTTYLTELNAFRVVRCFGKTVFLDRKEAKKALAEMRRNDG